ncbi:MAG TPA: carbohydrate ABC transporter permease [Chloroflexota bacterium]|nr:carbohydrate ABC transporter permease [Chloroflexota bacterium]
MIASETVPATRRRPAALSWLRATLAYLGLSVGAFILGLPLLWLLSTSLKEEGHEFLIPPEFIPQPLLWENYPHALTALPFQLYFLNTMIVVIMSEAGVLLTASMAAYAFSRLRFPGRDFLFILVLSSLMLPNVVTMIPKFVIFRVLDLVNTLAPLWLPLWFGGGAFNIFLIRQYALTLPRELDEAARIDGASNWQIYRQIILPLLRPALAAVAIFTFINGWNDFLEPLIYLHDDSKRTLALGLLGFQDLYATQWNLMMAASAVLTIPIVAVFLAAQRYFIKGISLTGLAGR